MNRFLERVAALRREEQLAAARLWRDAQPPMRHQARARKVSDGAKRRIAVLRASGLSSREVARAVGLSQRQVLRVVHSEGVES